MSIKIRTFFLNSSYFLKSIWTSGNSFLKDPSSLMMIHPKSNCKQKLTSHLGGDLGKPIGSKITPQMPGRSQLNTRKTKAEAIH